MPQFTAANSRLMAQRAHEARRRNATEREAEPARPQPGPQISPQEPALDAFTRLRLERVRKQLEKIDEMIEEETDPARLDRLAAAASRLSEQERRYAGRSLPPTVRATATDSRKLGGSRLFSDTPFPDDGDGDGERIKQDG